MKIIIEGAGQVGSHLAKMLSQEGSEITVIDNDPERIRTLMTTADVATIQGPPSKVELLTEAGCANADLFIAVNPTMNQSVNIVSALLAKKIGAKRVLATIRKSASGSAVFTVFANSATCISRRGESSSSLNTASCSLPRAKSMESVDALCCSISTISSLALFSG